MQDTGPGMNELFHDLAVEQAERTAADPIAAAEDTERKMPIQTSGPLALRERRGERVVVVKRIPFALVEGEPIERQSQRNHSQTVDRIAERGGYSACEALAVIAGLDWDRVSKLDEEAAHRILYAMHVTYNRGRRWGLAARAVSSSPSPREEKL